MRAQAKWEKVRLVILDEKSMVGLQTFGKMERCARQIMAKPSDSFGGLPFLLFGDFAQLPPVMDSSMYTNKSFQDPLKTGGSSLFRSFEKSMTLDVIH